MTAYFNGLKVADPNYKFPVSVAGGKKRSMIEIFNLASDAVGTYNIGAPIPVGARITAIRLRTDTAFGGTATIAIGAAAKTGAAANNTKYRAAALLNVTTVEDVAFNFGDQIAGAPEQLTMTVAAAALPASGRLTIEVQYTQEN